MTQTKTLLIGIAVALGFASGAATTAWLDRGPHGFAPAAAAQPAALQASASDNLCRDMHDMSGRMSAAHLTGDPDHDFVALMIPHHRTAIEMANVELKDGHKAEVKTLARGIIRAQHREIQQMQGWLDAWTRRK